MRRGVPLNVLLEAARDAYHFKDSGAKGPCVRGDPELPIGAMCEQAAAEAHTPHVFVLPRDAGTCCVTRRLPPPRREPHDTAVHLRHRVPTDTQGGGAEARQKW